MPSIAEILSILAVLGNNQCVVCDQVFRAVKQPLDPLSVPRLTLFCRYYEDVSVQ